MYYVLSLSYVIPTMYNIYRFSFISSILWKTCLFMESQSQSFDWDLPQSNFDEEII